MDGGNNLAFSWKTAPDKWESPIKTSPKEKWLQKTDKSPQRNKLGCKQTGSVTERRSAFECERKRPCTPQLQTRPECAASSQAEEMTMPRPRDTRAGPTSLQHTELFPYLRKTHCFNQWHTKSDNDNLVGVQRGAPGYPLGFTVNTQRKHYTRAFMQLLHGNYPQLTPQLLHQDSLRWPFIKYCQHASDDASACIIRSPRPSTNT